MFSANQTAQGNRKDSVINAETTGKFCWNLATYALKDAMNATAEQLPSAVDEFEAAGLEKEKARLSDLPMVKRSPVRFECEYHSTVRLPGNPPMGTVDVVIGKVLAVHIDDEVLTDGKIDVGKTMPIARCGYYEYAVVKETFEMRIPGDSAMTMYGLEGSSKKNREQGARITGQSKRSNSAGAEDGTT